MSEDRAYGVSLKYIDGTSAWIDCDSGEHVGLVIEMAKNEKKALAAALVYLVMTPDEIDALGLSVKPFGLAAGVGTSESKKERGPGQ